VSPPSILTTEVHALTFPSPLAALWRDGLDYRHGTGHGIGSHLNVHEGPHGIGTRIAYNEVKLQAGHVVSNEPGPLLSSPLRRLSQAHNFVGAPSIGYYEEGAFGIRIENVVVVQPADTPNNFGGTKFLKMERFTMVSSAPVTSGIDDSSFASAVNVFFFFR
jgi:Xaa-Pro aminopeptidase